MLLQLFVLCWAKKYLFVKRPSPRISSSDPPYQHSERTRSLCHYPPPSTLNLDYQAVAQVPVLKPTTKLTSFASLHSLATLADVSPHIGSNRNIDNRATSQLYRADHRRQRHFRLLQAWQSESTALSSSFRLSDSKDQRLVGGL